MCPVCHVRLVSGRGTEAESWDSRFGNRVDGDVIFREGFTGGEQLFAGLWGGDEFRPGCDSVTGPRSICMGCQWVRECLSCS